MAGSDRTQAPGGQEAAAAEGAEAPRLTLVAGPAGPALRSHDGTLVRAAVELLARSRQGKDLLLRAVGAAGAGRLIDATAGLGADSFHLAARGVRVLMIERVPEVAALLRATLASALEGAFGEAARESARNLELVEGDARELLARRVAAGERPGVVLLDPMYPERGKAALPPKGMAVFRGAVGADADAEELLTVALGCATDRVVVKRPLKAPPLGQVRPSGSLTGRTVRFDLYAPRPAALPKSGTGER